MKKKFHLGGIAALTLLGSFATSQAQTATTTPVGYTTETLQQGFNLIGLTLHQPTIASGAFESVSASSVTDTDITFTDASVLNTSGSATYILEITSGALAGSIQDITAWSANALTTPDDLLAAGLLAGDTYSIRKASTIADIFGADNSAGFQGVADFNSTNADLIYLQNESGDFDRFFFSTNTTAPGTTDGWFRVRGTARSNDQAIIYTDSLLIERKGVNPIDLVVTGEVKTTSTTVFLGGGNFTYVGGVYPAGTTLGNSGIETNLQGVADFNSTNADVLYLPNGEGGYDRFFYSTNTSVPGTTDGWFRVRGTVRSNDEPLPSGIIIQRRGGDTTTTISAPATN